MCRVVGGRGIEVSGRLGAYVVQFSKAAYCIDGILMYGRVVIIVR